jgi:AraC family transcriptional regulator
MKPSTENSYHERIDRVVGYLSEQVQNSPSLTALAEVAAISPFHFHRVYRAVTGETPSMTLRRLKLTKACVLLRDTSKSITEIAFDAGYESSQSFAKAFRAAIGSSPSEIRSAPKALEEVIGDLSQPRENSNADFSNIEIKISSIDPITVVAARHHGPHKGLFQSYGELFAHAQKLGWVENFQGIYGIPIDDRREMDADVCRFDCCFDFGPTTRATAPYRDEVLGGGLYAVMRHVGHYDELEEKYDYLYDAWLDKSAYQLREAPIFNHYLQDPESVPPEEWETDIYLPIQMEDER